MGYTFLQPEKTSTKKPPSELTASLGIDALNVLRTQFEITTWLSLGAILQCLLFALPLKPHLAALPAIALVLWRITDNALMHFGLKRNRYMDDVIPGKFSAIYPSATEEGPPASEEVCVLVLAARCNSVLGMLDPAFKALGAYFETMLSDLEANAAQHGWTGCTSYIKSTDRTTSSEVMLLHYFKSLEHLHAFAHSKTHRDGWDWWNRNAKEMKHIGIMHEAYSVPKGRWETIYANYQAGGFAGTRHLVGREGEQKWVSPVVSATEGRMRSSEGRIGLEKTGGGNEKYGPEPYDV